MMSDSSEFASVPGHFDSINPRLALGDGVGSQLVLPLVFSTVHYTEAHLEFNKCKEVLLYLVSIA